MLSISDTLHPCYKDFIFAGITEFATNRIVYAIRGHGVHEITFHGSNTSQKKFLPFLQKQFSPHRIIAIDCYKSEYEKGITTGMSDFEQFMGTHVVQPLQGKLHLQGAISSAALCLDLVAQDVDAVANMVAKGVFEPPAMYLMTKELGGIATDLTGVDLTEKEWGPVGMNLEGALFSSSPEIHTALLAFLKPHNSSPKSM
jgi:fructose-1,6-bisphosphatase/inositol monophosphatase family enzyme